MPKKHKINTKRLLMMHCNISNSFPSSSLSPYRQTHIHTCTPPSLSSPSPPCFVCLSLAVLTHHQHKHTRNQTPFIHRDLLCPAQMPPPHLFILQSTLHPFCLWSCFGLLLSDISFSIKQYYGQVDGTFSPSLNKIYLSKPHH